MFLGAISLIGKGTVWVMVHLVVVTSNWFYISLVKSDSSN